MRRLYPHLLATLLFTTGFVLFAGCASAPFRPEKAKPATLEQLRIIGAPCNGLDVLLYKGSDAQYHYFHHSRLGGGGTYRIPRSKWKPPKEYPLGQEIGGAIPTFSPAAQ
jgi:hypothetical protein